MSDGLKEIADK